MTIQNIPKNLYRTFISYRSRLRAALNTLRYWRPDGYDAKSYWHNRLKKFGLDNLRGVGRAHQSHEENLKTYAEARNVFLRECAIQGVVFEQSEILDIGCGTGFYTQICKSQGATRYSAVDITDILFKELREKFLGYSFARLDITSQEPEGMYDLIIMIDVTQHITSPRKFSVAMQNLRRHVRKGGCIVLTSWLSHKTFKGFHETARTIDAYQREFPDFIFSEPVPFRDKFLFTLKAPL
jgi:2-polyprenyl-3-methyl-5-hydroxy-6-metoxy-1,4-benzoquinol methylase